MLLHEENLNQIERIASSPSLRGSESLCRLLRYLAQQTLDHPGVPIREYHIATQVFGRPPEFDPRLDSTVRVQTGRLRSKLTDYYRNSGATDPVLVEIPKGTYQLTFEPHQAGLLPPQTIASQQTPGQRERIARRQPGWIAAFAGMTALAVGLAIALTFLLLQPPRPPASDAAATGDQPLQSFWTGLLDSSSAPLIVFSGGVGDTLAIHQLDSIFALFQRVIPARPASMFTADDRLSHDLIIVGPPPDNIGLRGFRFQPVAGTSGIDGTEIVNLYPLPGEADHWISRPSAAEDYGIIALEPGLAAGRWILILAGVTSAGTEAAADFVCHQSTVRDLLSRAGHSRFEALIYTKVVSGAPVDAQLIAVHPADR